jgi:hypothetical protein
MQYLFIDESGDHNLVKIDPTFPLFVLTGVIFSREEYQQFQRNLIDLKKHIFGTEKIILHSLEMTRTRDAKQQKLKLLANPVVRKEFYTQLNDLLKKHNWSWVGFVIDKPKFAKIFDVTPPDPYFLSFNAIFGKFAEHLDNKEEARIFTERRSSKLDKQFLLAWESTKNTDKTNRMHKYLVTHKIYNPKICEKAWDNCGLELADLISFRLSRFALGKPEKPQGNEVDFEIMKSKKHVISGLPKPSFIR